MTQRSSCRKLKKQQKVVVCLKECEQAKDIVAVVGDVAGRSVVEISGIVATECKGDVEAMSGVAVVDGVAIQSGLAIVEL